VAAVNDGNPVMYIDDRWLYAEEGEVPQTIYESPIGKAAILRSGTDVTIVASSYLVPHALKAAAQLAEDGVSAEVVDLRSIKPWDKPLVYESLGRTGRLVIADGGWRTCGVAAEIAASVVEDAFDALRSPVVRVTLPDSPAPMARRLEDAYYVKTAHIVAAVERLLGMRSPVKTEPA
jgi:pyruvate/2-oxoglutarate/acetoin dehydrogenase E1 component